MIKNTHTHIQTSLHLTINQALSPSLFGGKRRLTVTLGTQPFPATLPACTWHTGTRAAPCWPLAPGLGGALQPSQTALAGSWMPRSRGSGGIPHPRSRPRSSALRHCRPWWPPRAGMMRPCVRLSSSDRVWRRRGGLAHQSRAQVAPNSPSPSSLA